MDTLKAILKINPNAKVNITKAEGEVEDTIEWLHGTAEISKADIDAKKAEFAYLEPRQRAYPSIQEQLDMQYHDAVNGTTTWKDAIAQVKADNPKSEE
jgi:hypothetical protein